MRFARLELEVELPDDYSESEIDTAIADAIAMKGGRVLDSKEYEELTEDELTNY